MVPAEREVRYAALAALLVLTATGCSHLIIHDDDPFAKKAMKFTTRSVLVFPTLVWSEVFMRRAKYEERIRESQAAVDQLFAACRDAASEEEGRKACMTFEYERQKHGALLSGYEQWQAGVAEAAASVQRSTAAIGQSAPRRCTSTVIGNTVYTDCY